jgi:protocatechuate 3,4-dioxygenase beta subunit
MSSRNPFAVFQRPPANARRYYDPVDKERYVATSRRTVVKGAAAVAAMGAVGLSAVTAVQAQDAAEHATADASESGVCVLTPELTEGPYYLDDQLIREDIAENKAGIPLDLAMTIVNASTCAPLANAAVEIWHCDALGFYSGFTENSPGGGDAYVDDGSDPDTFLRGIQITADDGLAHFSTIYPGWYTGRDIHIHMKVHIGGEAENGTYDGGHTSHTGQLAFADEITDEVALVAPYSTKTSDFTRLEEDSVFSDVEDRDTTFFLDLVRIDDADISAGFTGTIVIGIDPDAEHSGAGMGNGRD